MFLYVKKKSVLKSTDFSLQCNTYFTNTGKRLWPKNAHKNVITGHEYLPDLES